MPLYSKRSAGALVALGALLFYATSLTPSRRRIDMKQPVVPVATPSPPTPPPAPAVVYLVFPSVVNPSKHPARVAAIQDTWGKDAPVAFAGHDDFALPEDLADKPTGGADYIHWVYMRALEKWPEALWYVKVDDCTYVLPANMERYVATRDPRALEIHGRRLKIPGKPKDLFPSGGAGFAVSAAAVRYLRDHYTPDECAGEGWYNKAVGDIGFANCLPEAAMIDTREVPGEPGRERFLSYGPQRSMSGKVDDWFRKYTPWYEVEGGLACCARDLLTFHYVEDEETRAIHDVLFNPARWRDMTDEQRIAAWPKRGEGLTGWSTPPHENDPMWELLLSHIRV